MNASHPGAPDERVRHVDGNALAGLLSEVFVSDASMLVLSCRQCGTAGPLGGTDVEDDGVGAIVRCRHCSRTLLTVLRTGSGVTLSVAALAQLDVPRPEA
ncbi:DUF6510 family protein [Microbacterium caowuchunii]|uniref:Uncharacterized protein n=1 Tax=Microbacterium caowuchunii TaxID=2614638 RepID=A0A5N0TK34_9MICO|nr:DUF6510 family protein [Microbacterium caowuchunii]KAA9134901.1 hypothetical protein F6B40_04195 [Microbacterium caowuchunii]